MGLGEKPRNVERKWLKMKKPKSRKTALGSRGHLCGTQMAGWDSSFYFMSKLHPHVHTATENASCSRDASTVVVASQGLEVTVLCL